ncbi:hypothetical protein FE257_004085 [Aspergillus nanangensis]|uniref:Uncharacterized protein n=1 Tax=Aspergillus nanangensis TaxID=2582783 RepID=A0AAD4GN88_ASPNN|nr:hypothetical protein FE257_004085 [Aspergillus nanangensis]
MQAPPPTPTSGYLSLSGTPPGEPEQFLANSLPSLARILNNQIAAMDYVNNALMEHLNQNLLMERFEAINIANSDEVKDNDPDTNGSNNLPNGHSEGNEPPMISNAENSPTESHHSAAGQGDGEINSRSRRSYSMSDVDHIIAQSSPPPAMALEVVRALQLSDAEIRRTTEVLIIFVKCDDQNLVTLLLGIIMSPAPVVMETPQDLQLQTLGRAFEALLLTTQQLGYKERRLQQRLEYANSEYLKLADRLPSGPDTHTKVISEKILGRYTEYEPSHKSSLNPPDVVKALAESGNVGEHMLTAITEGLECYQSLLHGKPHSHLADANQCVVATRAGVPPALEKDFTTKGTQGQLRCPFAKPQHKTSENGVSRANGSLSQAPNGDACGHADLDPITAEKSDRRSSHAPSGSVRSSTTQCPVFRCPIRYLDKHSPEEVAEYVEKHKHEIPRSHAICVQRYQKDSSSMRQLDAKYGSLINMIRGLSVKHQAFLPARNNSEAQGSSTSAERVEKWAEEVGLKSETQPSVKEEKKEPDHAEEERKGHFDRPLREVRVGESPSRPWGIPVPVPQPSSVSQPPAAPVSASMGDQSNDLPGLGEMEVPSLPPFHDEVSSRKPGRCPFGHGAPAPAPAPTPAPVQARDEGPALDPVPETETIRNAEQADEAVEEESGKVEGGGTSPPSPTANVIFNGPVFFGFSPEQTASFIQQLSRLNNTRMG